MYPLWRQSYQKVSHDDSDTGSDDETSYSTPKSKRYGSSFGFERNAKAIYLLRSAIGIALILGIAGIWYKASHSTSSASVHQHQHPDENQSAHGHSHGHEHENVGNDKAGRVCGDTEAEAMSLGCTFDPMTWAWLSPSCPRYARDEFVSAGTEPWSYYMDAQGSVVLEGSNWTKALNNEVRVYTKRSEHLTHCLYTFLSMAQVIRDATPTHPRLSSYGHIHHCVDILLDSVKMDKDWEKIDTDMGLVSYDEGC